MSACFVGGALSSYVTVSLAPVALLQLAAPVVELTIVLTGAQNQTLSDRSVCLILRCKFNDREDAVFFAPFLVSHPTYVIFAPG